MDDFSGIKVEYTKGGKSWHQLIDRMLLLDENNSGAAEHKGMLIKASKEFLVLQFGEGGTFEVLEVPAKRLRKLVRDKIPEVLTEEMKSKNPKFFPVEDLPPDEQHQLWMAKLQEELDELKEAFTEGSAVKRMEEYGDLMEVLAGFSRYFHFSLQDLKLQQERKGGRNGRFLLARVMEYDG